MSFLPILLAVAVIVYQHLVASQHVLEEYPELERVDVVLVHGHLNERKTSKLNQAYRNCLTNNNASQIKISDAKNGNQTIKNSRTPKQT